MVKKEEDEDFCIDAISCIKMEIRAVERYPESYAKGYLPKLKAELKRLEKGRK